MVFVKREIPSSLNVGMLITRDTGKYVVLLIVEAIFGLLVVLANIIIISVILAGWKKLLRNPFYVILSNLLVLTSMKGLVELGFILPYYIMQKDRESTSNFEYTLFTTQYDSLVFNMSVLADYGILFFSLLIAVNRYFSVMASSKLREHRWSSLKIIFSCAITWAFSTTVPLFFYFCDCEYSYNNNAKVYYNRCEKGPESVMTIINSLIYLIYACTALVLLIYLLIYIFLERQKRKTSMSEMPCESHRSSIQMKLLKQSAVVFALYACSIGSVFALSYMDANVIGYFQIAYIENLLNLSIAAAYPICFLVMSGEMKSILIAGITPSMSGRVQSVTISSRKH